jgi:hypothetical protein
MDRTSKAERLQQGITLLKKLRETGIAQDNGGFVEIQGLISAWVSDGLPLTVTVPIPRYDRDAILTLTTDKATIILRKVE